MEDSYFDEDSFYMKNPNLYVTLAESDHSGYILKEDGGLLLTENTTESVLLT